MKTTVSILTKRATVVVRVRHFYATISSQNVEFNHKPRRTPISQMDIKARVLYTQNPSKDQNSKRFIKDTQG